MYICRTLLIMALHLSNFTYFGPTFVELYWCLPYTCRTSFILDLLFELHKLWTYICRTSFLLGVSNVGQMTYFHLGSGTKHSDHHYHGGERRLRTVQAVSMFEIKNGLIKVGRMQERWRSNERGEGRCERNEGSGDKRVRDASRQNFSTRMYY